MRRPHLPLRKVGESDRPPGRGPRTRKARRDSEAFCRTQIRLLDALKVSYERDRKAVPRYIDPNLVFKIELLSDVHDDTFRRELKGVGIHTISSAPDAKGYWVAFVDDSNFTEFRQKLEKYTTDTKPGFIDQIKAVREIPPEEKMSESLSGRPVPGDEWEYVDVEVWRMDDERLEKFVSGMRTMRLPSN